MANNSDRANRAARIRGFEKKLPKKIAPKPGMAVDHLAVKGIGSAWMNGPKKGTKTSNKKRKKNAKVQRKFKK